MKRRLPYRDGVDYTNKQQMQRQAVHHMSVQECIDAFVSVACVPDFSLLQVWINDLDKCVHYTRDQKKSILVDVFRYALRSNSVNVLKCVVFKLRELDLNIPSCIDAVHSNDPDMLLWVFKGDGDVPLACVNAVNVFGGSALHVAVLIGNIPVVISLLTKCGADINLLNEQNETPLFLAILDQNFLMVACLLKHGASTIRPATSVGTSTSALLYCIEQQFTDLVSLMLAAEMQPDLTERNDRNETPLLVATRQNNTAMVQLILASDHCMPAYVRSCDRIHTWCTPLVHAVHHCNIRVIQSLLEAQASPNSDSIEETSALVTAAFRSDTIVMKMLLECPSVQPDETSIFYDQSQASNEQYSMYTCTNDQALIDATASTTNSRNRVTAHSNPVARVNVDGRCICTGNSNHLVIWVRHCTALQLACARGDLQMVQCLTRGDMVQGVQQILYHTRRANVQLRTENGNTALLYAVSGGHLTVVRYLIEHCNASLTHMVRLDTPLFTCAVRMDRMEVVQYLMRAVHGTTSTLRKSVERIMCLTAIQTHNHRCLEWLLKCSLHIAGMELYTEMAMSLRKGVHMYADLRQIEWLNNQYPMAKAPYYCQVRVVRQVNILMHLIAPQMGSRAGCYSNCSHLIQLVKGQCESRRGAVQSFFETRIPGPVIGLVQLYTDSVVDSIEFVMM
jgi:ankyrin repeat protein